MDNVLGSNPDVTESTEKDMGQTIRLTAPDGHEFDAYEAAPAGVARGGLVEGSWEGSLTGQNRRYYHITHPGREKLGSMLREWKMFTEAVNMIAQPVRKLA